MTTAQQALESIESFVAANPDFAKESPDQFAKITRVRDELKKSPGKPSPALEKLVKELFVWQLDAQRAEYAAQLEEAKKAAAKTPGPAVEKAKAALAEVVKFLDEAKALGFPPAPGATEKLEKAVLRVQAAFHEADVAASNTTRGVTLKPVKRPITSSTGIPLKPADPPPRGQRR